MESFLLVEPSADIHLVLDPAFTNTAGQPLKDLPLKVWFGERIGVDGGFSYEPADPFASYDMTTSDQQIVRVTNGVLTPLKKGTAFIQIRVDDLRDNNYYHYLIIRVMVHGKMDNWWFGNEALRVFKHPERPHTQPSIYASFDDGAVIGDITAHDYVTLTAGNATFSVADDPNNPWRGRIKGNTVGTGILTGSLLGKQRPVEIKVEDFGIDNNRILEPLRVDRTSSPRQKFNILFIAEGFKEKGKFDKICKKVVDKLFSLPHNSPYNLLKDDFNVWTAFHPSDEEGITVASRVCRDGAPMPFFGPDDHDQKDGFYSLKRLSQLVGLSTETALQRGINPQSKEAALPPAIDVLKAAWVQDPVAIELDIDPAKIPTQKPHWETIVNWMDQVPLNRIPQAKNTYYGFVAGNRPGEKQSAKQLKTPPENSTDTHRETWFIPGHPTFKPNLFAARIRDWIMPNNHNVWFAPALDNRRWAPDLYQYEDNIDAAWVRHFIEQHVSKFNDSSTTPIDASFQVGQVWNKENLPNLQTRSYNSAGLVCFLINSPLTGQSANHLGNFIGAIIGRWNGYKKTEKSYDDNEAAFREQTPETHLHKFFVEPHVDTDDDHLLGMISHELAHSFNLGDEYEKFRKVANPHQVRLFDNLVHHNHIMKESQEHGSAKPIDPEKLPWSVLHRIKYAITIAEPVTITNKNTIEAVVAPGDMDTVAKIIQENEKVFLHKFIGNYPEYNHRLLRIDPVETWTKDMYEELELSSELDPVTRKITLNTVTGSRPLEFPLTGPEDNFIPAGSYLYVPVRDESGTPRFLIEKEVMSFMRNTSYGGSAPVGRALSENFDEHTTWNEEYETQNLDEIAVSTKNNADNPASIPDFKGPCKKFRMIGAYEGGARYVGAVYRPTGACKMRDSLDHTKYDAEKEFCFVCKYLIVSRVNPSKLGALDKQYPESKEEKWKRMTDNAIRQNEDMPSI